MKISQKNVKEIVNALEIHVSNIAKKPSLEILKMVKIEIIDESFGIISTDSDKTLISHVTMEEKADEEMFFCIDPKILIKVLKTKKNGVGMFFLGEEKLFIDGGVSLNYCSHDLFPILPLLDEKRTNTYIFDKYHHEKLIEIANIPEKNKNYRYSDKVMLFKDINNNIGIFATDAKIIMSNKELIYENEKIILTRETVNLIKKINPQIYYSVCECGNNILFEIHGHLLMQRKVEDCFNFIPKINEMLSNKKSLYIEINETVKNYLKESLSFKRDDFITKFEVIDENHVKISFIYDYQNFNETFVMNHNLEQDFVFGFNVKRLLSIITGNSLKLLFNDNRSPFVSEFDSYISAIFPIRFED